MALRFDILARNLTGGAFADVERRAGVMSGRVGQAAAKIGRVFAGVGIGAAAAGGAITMALREPLREMDRFAKSSRAIGLTTEQLSRMTWAADLSGVSFEKLVGSVGKLAKSMSDSLRSTSSEQAIAFRALGIQVTTAEGNMRSVREVIDDIANRFAAMRDSTEKTTLATALFGRSGRELIPLLNQGAVGIRAMGDEAQRFGLVISDDAGRRAEMFNDTINRIRSQLRGFRYQLTSSLLPALQALADHFFNAERDGGRFQSMVTGATRLFKVFTIAGIGAIDTVRFLATGISAAYDGINLLLDGRSAEANERMERAWADIGQMIQGSADTIVAIWQDAESKIRDVSLFPGASGSGRGSGVDLVGTIAGDGDGKANDPWSGLRKRANGTFAAIERRGAMFANTIASQFVRMNEQGRLEFGDLRQVGIQIFNSFAQQLLAGFFNPVGQALGGLFGGMGGLGGGFGFAGFFDRGGRIPAGMFGVVGERRPELVEGPATVTPLASLAGGAGGGGFIQVVSRVIVENGQIAALVESVSGQVAGQMIQAAAPQIQATAVDSARQSYANQPHRWRPA